jgi:membrane fusion protein (multidrug efflux system)
MKTLSTLMLSLIVLAMTACGGGDPLTQKKAELEKLKAEQTELSSKISILEDEIIALGDSGVNEVRTKVIATTAIAKQRFIHGIDVQGKVDGDENITYSAKVPSVVSKINVKVGDRVKAGQILAELDAKVSRAQLEGALKQYELANTVYEKRKALWDQKVGSEIEFLQAKNAKESLEKTIQSAREGLDMYYIKADYSGTVDVVSIKVGQAVSPGIPAITVVNPDKLKVKAQLSEAYASNIKQGDDVTLRFPDINKDMKAKVSYASKSIDPMTRTFNVEVNLANDNDLHPNMVAEIKIVDYIAASTIVVPINTIQQIDNEDVVFIAVKSGNQLIAKKVPVTVGKTYNGLAEIRSGLNEGDELITVGYQDLTNGQALKQ